MTTRVRIKKGYLPKGWSDKEYNARHLTSDVYRIGKTTFLREKLVFITSPKEPAMHFVRKMSSVKDNEAIHCPTEREAEAICKLFNEQGWKWNSGRSFLYNTNWSECKSDTYYCPKKGVYGNIKDAGKHNYTITQASAFLPKSFYEEQPKEHSITEDVPVLDNKYTAIGAYIENESPSARELFTWLLANEHL